MSTLPAWSEAFLPGRLRPVRSLLSAYGLTREQAWGDGRGTGVRVAVIDSGIDAEHPRVRGVAGGVAVEVDDDGGTRFTEGPHGDLYGHGTACAGILRGLAPDCEIHSVRVLGSTLRGRGSTFAAGLEWAIDAGMQVINLSLSSRSTAYLAAFHSLLDRAAYAGVMLVSAISNVPAPSYPSQLAGVFSVAAYEGRDPEQFVVNPEPPVEFGAPGIDLEVAWSGGGTIVATGNSFAAPHIAGLLARIVAAHPGITTAEAKALLRALASNIEDLSSS